MNRIDNLFGTKDKNILSVFYPAGYPTLNDTMPILEELQTQGVDMVEIGIPFSDPMADGVVIQQASTTAIKNGISLRKIFEQLETMRDKITIPVILMGYLNPIMRYGFEEFCISCQSTGVDGVIIPDLPFEDYIQNYKPVAQKYGIKVIMLITPETAEERIRLIDANTSGFIYMVSSASTTGAQSSFAEDKINYFKAIDSLGLRNPRLIGFGISNRETFDAACDNASGAIIGSHFVNLLSDNKTIHTAIETLMTIRLKGN